MSVFRCLPQVYCSIRWIQSVSYTHLQLMEDAEEGAKQLKEKGKLKELVIQTCQSDVNTQLNQMNQMINEGVDCILLDPASTTALADAVQTAVEMCIRDRY